MAGHYMRNVHRMDEVEVFSKAVLEAFCPRVCTLFKVAAETTG